MFIGGERSWGYMCILVMFLFLSKNEFLMLVLRIGEGEGFKIKKEV